jgi:alkane 1-monooxygenase
MLFTVYETMFPMRSWKYLLALNVPVFVFLSLWLPGGWSFLALAYAFGLVPVLELLLPVDRVNLTKAEEEVVREDWIYDALIYINVPIQWGLVAFYLYLVAFTPLTGVEWLGKSLSLGVASVALGINVAHELGHRTKAYERAMSKVLLASALYMHFIIEHNLGHHRNVSTDDDPASAPYGMSLYAFLPRSVWGGYRSAWELEAQRLRNKGQAFWSLHNEMLRFSVIQIALIAVIGVVFGPLALAGFVLSAAMGVGLLETVNYIEHYGLRRHQKDSGRYERVLPHHSWNSSHPYGRLMLYEISRHSDHHYQANRPYQILRHFEDAPQMPTGYPAMVLLATVPPLWFAVMNPRVDRVMAAAA